MAGLEEKIKCKFVEKEKENILSGVNQTEENTCMSTIESVKSSNGDKKGFVKKNRNFRQLKNNQSNQVQKSENIQILQKNENFQKKSFFKPKKEKSESYNTMTRNVLNIENNLTEITNEIKDKYEDEVLEKKTKMLLYANTQVKMCKKEILKRRKRNNSESKIYFNSIR